MSLVTETTQTVSCPHCQQQQTCQVYPYIQLDKQPQHQAALAAGTLFNFTCQACQKSHNMTYPVLLENRSKGYAIFLMPQFSGSVASLNLEDVIEPHMVPTYRQLQLRVVKTLPDLVEKVAIFDSGLNDAVVECVKILSHALFREQFPNEPVLGMYFYKQGTEPTILAVCRDRQGMLPYNEQLMAAAYKKRSRDFFTVASGQFQLIDRSWAIHALELS